MNQWNGPHGGRVVSESAAMFKDSADIFSQEMGIPNSRTGLIFTLANVGLA